MAGENFLSHNSVGPSHLFHTFEIDGIFVIVLVVISSPFKWLARVILSVFLVAKTEIGSLISIDFDTDVSVHNVSDLFIVQNVAKHAQIFRQNQF